MVMDKRQSVRYSSPNILMSIEGTFVELVDISMSAARLYLKSPNKLPPIKGNCSIIISDKAFNFQYHVSDLRNNHELIIEFDSSKDDKKILLEYLAKHAVSHSVVEDEGTDDFIEKREAFRISSSHIQLILDDQRVDLIDISCSAAAVKSYNKPEGYQGCCLLIMPELKLMLNFMVELTRRPATIIRFIHEDKSEFLLLGQLKKLLWMGNGNIQKKDDQA